MADEERVRICQASKTLPQEEEEAHLLIEHLETIVQGNEGVEIRLEERGSSQRMAYSDSKDSSLNELVEANIEKETKMNALDPNIGGSERLEYLDEERAELLKKLEELRDQLSRSCDMTDKSKRVAANRWMKEPSCSEGNRDTWFPGSSSASSHMPPSRSSRADVQRSAPFFNNDPVPSINRHDWGDQICYPPIHPSDGIPGYGDAFHRKQMLTTSHHQSRQLFQRTPKDYIPGEFAGIDSEPVTVYPHNALIYAQTACSCFNCHNKHWSMPGQVPPQVFSTSRLPTSSANHMLHQIETPSNFIPGFYDYRCTNIAPSWVHERVSHLSNPSDLDSEMVAGDFRRLRLHRAVIANGNERICKPIASGAPFITCYSCFQLLQLPVKLYSLKKKQGKLRCGACSEVISFSLNGKRIVFHFPCNTKSIPSDISDNSGDVIEERGLNMHVDQGILDESGDDCHNSLDTGFVLSSPVKTCDDTNNESILSSSCSKKLRGLSSASMSSESSDSLVTQRDRSASNANLSLSLPSSPPHQHVRRSPTNIVGSNGSRSKRSEQESVISIKETSRQNSVKDASAATEIECSFNGFSSESQDSGAASKEKDQPKFSKGDESFFAGLIKKSFKDFGRQNQLMDNGKSSVSINGHPIPVHLIQKAEKQAGTIRPGQYWYDYRAGFWGVMGYPCLGIIPPSIEEFNYPLPENCSAGNTGVFVNGRELHKKDLELMVSRGLPPFRDRYYIVEISGMVLDEATGEELDSLGRLAPSVMKLKRGYGMHVPRAMAGTNIS